MSKKDALSLWLTRLAWGLIVLDVAFAFVPSCVLTPRTMNPETILLLNVVFAIWLFGTLCAATTWLIIRHRTFFSTWVGWLSPFSAVILSTSVTQGAIPVKHEVLFALFTILQIVSIWSIVPITILRLLHKDRGLRMVSWGLLLVIWSYFFAWQLNGNLIEKFLLNLSDLSQPRSLWWLNSLMCILWWIIPAGAIGFIGHTIRLLIRELRSDDFVQKVENVQ